MGGGVVVGFFCVLFWLNWGNGVDLVCYDCCGIVVVDVLFGCVIGCVSWCVLMNLCCVWFVFLECVGWCWYFMKIGLIMIEFFYGDGVICCMMLYGFLIENIYVGVLLFMCCNYLCVFDGIDVVIFGVLFDFVMIYCFGVWFGLVVICVVSV